MKYAVFAIVAIGVIPLAALLTFNVRWMKYAFWGVVVAMCLYQQTAINFFSHESYRGSSRGMEVSLIYLLALAILLALAVLGRARGILSDGGVKLYVLYFLLCLPSLLEADDLLIAWFEIWKMIMLFLVYCAVRAYLKATDDVKTVLKALAVFVIANTLFTVKAHYAGVYQPSGVFPHRNGMAMGMLLLGPLFFAGYLAEGTWKWRGRIYAAAFSGAVLSTLWSYSRGAIAMIPIAYGLVTLAMLAERCKTPRKLIRILPLAILGVFGLLVALPRIVERFQEAPKSSGDTRVALAACALEMIKDKPITGIGINNWSLNMDSTHPYLDRTEDKLGLPLKDTGIVETVYLLVCAECGIPALLAMLAWFAWYWFLCLRLMRRMRSSEWYFVPAGLFGGLSANYMQSVLEWVLRQQLSLVCLMFVFAVLAHLWARSGEARGNLA